MSGGPGPGRPRFPRSGLLRTGYAPTQVERYFARVEQAFAAGDPVSPGAIRRAGFDLVRNGYLAAPVDAALDRLEQRALEEERQRGPDPQRLALELEREIAAVRAELARPAGARFPRAARLQRGYSVAEVDGFCDRIAAMLAGGRGPGARAVRSAVFAPQRGGYAELPVDELLDRVVDVLLRHLAGRS